MISTPSLYQTAVNARSLAGKEGAGDEIIQKVIADAINDAVFLGNMTTTASVSGYGQAFIQDNIRTLKDLGYVVSLSSTTLTISW